VAQPLVDRADRATRTMQLPPPHPVIVPATDLGGVGVLKHGNLFLLTDPFGDVHPDSRGLGLYDLDTRVLSCAVLRINGVRPTLLRDHPKLIAELFEEEADRRTAALPVARDEGKVLARNGGAHAPTVAFDGVNEILDAGVENGRLLQIDAVAGLRQHQ